MTNIEWTDKTWNPIVGCSVVSPGCTNCYAMKMAARLERMNPALAHYQGLTKIVNGNAVWTGRMALAPDHVLTAPLRHRKPAMYFVNSMSDLFHESVPDAWIDRVFAVMALCPQHTFQVLTKRSVRMCDYCSYPGVARRIHELACDLVGELDLIDVVLVAPSVDPNLAPPGRRVFLGAWPLSNVWLGVSCERQQEADARIPDLLATPAAVRFVSAEPLLGPVDFTPFLPRAAAGSTEESRRAQLSWVIVGGESGPGARPMHPDWARAIRDQCVSAEVRFFFKQWGNWLVGERQEPSDDLTWQPDVTFQDGSDFAVLSDGHDILLGNAEDEKTGPTHLWREFWGWQGHLIKKSATKSQRLLDGREWSQMPAQRAPSLAKDEAAA